MADFTLFLPHLLAAEGGYCHTPGDAGQETWCGIARAYHPGWGGWGVVDAAKARLGLRSPVPRAAYARLNQVLGADAALAAQLQRFYRALCWEPLGLDELRSQAVAGQLADHAVNAGPGRPPRMLQFVLRQLGHAEVAEDGRLGPRTLAAANACPAPALFRALVALRQDFYRYRAGRLVLPATDARRGLFERLRLQPDPSQAQFLAGWLARVQAIPAPGA